MKRDELIQPTLKEIWDKLYRCEVFYKFNQDAGDNTVSRVIEIIITPSKFILKSELGGIATIFRKELNRVV
jgi:hypothetical protein